MKVRLAASLGAIALALAGLVFVPRLLAGDPATPLTFDDYYAIEGELTCDTTVKEVPALPLEAEPWAMLVCADPKSSVPWVAPAEVVEGDLAPIVDVLGALEPAPDGQYDCTAQGGPAFDLILRFSRGRVARIHGELGGCGVTSTASGDYFGAADVLDAALRLVEEQRAAQPVPTTLPKAPPCPTDADLAPAWSLIGRATDMVVAVSCWRPDAKSLGPYGHRVRVPTKDLRVLMNEAATHRTAAGDVGAYDCPGGPKRLYYQTIVGRTAYGDLVELQGICHEFYLRAFGVDPNQEMGLWYPSTRSQRILDRLRR